MQSQAYIVTLIEKIIKTALNSKSVIMLEYQNIKVFFQKAMFQTGLKKFLWLKKLKIRCSGHMLLMVSTEKNLLREIIAKNKLKRV